jgi:hypothetical protein
MSDENENKESKANAVTNVINFFKSNPKALYALVGAVVVVALAIAMSGGGEEIQVKTTLTPGQTVTLDNPNVGDTQLMAVPGKLSSIEAEGEEGQNICLAKKGTSATVEEETTVNFIPYVKVSVKDGPCQGKSGWTPKVNVKTK